MAAEKLSENELEAALVDLPDWERDGDRIRRRFQFGDFLDAMAFMNRVAPVAEELNHHPEWSNVYNRVIVELTTHDAGGLTSLDIQFAQRCDRLADDS